MLVENFDKSSIRYLKNQNLFDRLENIGITIVGMFKHDGEIKFTSKDEKFRLNSWVGATRDDNGKLIPYASIETLWHIVKIEEKAIKKQKAFENGSITIDQLPIICLNPEDEKYERQYAIVKPNGELIYVDRRDINMQTFKLKKYHINVPCSKAIKQELKEMSQREIISDLVC